MLYPLGQAVRLEAEYQLWLDTLPNYARNDREEFLNHRRNEFDAAYLLWRRLPDKEFRALPDWVRAGKPTTRHAVREIRRARLNALADELRAEKGVERLHPHDYARLRDIVGL